MRKKTEAKRTAILVGAAEVFAANGYEGTTLAEVARTLSCSKATIYNYFVTKDDLLQAILVEGFRPTMQALLAGLKSDAPFETRLRDFARAYAAVMGSPYSVPSLRLLISQVGRSDLPQSVHGDPEIDPWPHVERLIAEEVAAGRLSGAPADKITGQLRALICGGPPYLQLIGAAEGVSVEALRLYADEAVALILRGYAAAPHK
jgi:AcrR family transcriptional regulator